MVEKLSEASGPEWWRVATVLNGNSLVGFTAHAFLQPEEEVSQPAGEQSVRAVHLRENRSKVTRQNQQLLAFPLGESDRPERSLADPSRHVQELLAIVDYLAVDVSPRYEKRNGDTFCNIYAYDYCYLAQVYLPRVWWTGSSLERLTRGEVVPVQAGATVTELNANSLVTWFKDFGGRFGWIRIFSETELQEAANLGRVCAIAAQRVALNTPGHIVVVVPENGANVAKRTNGALSVPLQSQAGGSNFRFGTSLGRWWTQSKFREFGFWVHL
jgi:hypothetical protein